MLVVGSDNWILESPQYDVIILFFINIIFSLIHSMFSFINDGLIDKLFNELNKKRYSKFSWDTDSPPTLSIMG